MVEKKEELGTGLVVVQCVYLVVGLDVNLSHFAWMILKILFIDVHTVMLLSAFGALSRTQKSISLYVKIAI